MTISTDSIPDRLNRRLAWLLGFGSWLSCTLIACGMLLSAVGVTTPRTDEKLVSAGIVLLIALPTMRVAMMSAWFLIHRNLDFALISAVVLGIIIASTLSGAVAA
jgi:hypothetical protein